MDRENNNLEFIIARNRRLQDQVTKLEAEVARLEKLLAFTVSPPEK